MRLKLDWSVMRSIACLLLAFGVIAGAFGAHSLNDILTSERMDVFKTGVFYQIAMSTVLLFLSSEKGTGEGTLKWLTLILFAGIIIFSGSLYTLVIFKMPMLGAITPLGGSLIIISLFMAAWHFRK